MAEQPFADRLTNGERIVWCGRPGQGLIFMPDDAFNIPVSLLLLGFFIYITVIGWPAFTSYGVLVICVALYWTVGRFLIDARIRHGTHYALTDRRVLIARPSPYSSVRWPRPIFREVHLGPQLDISLIEHRAGRGTVRFGAPIRILDAQYRYTWIPSLDPRLQLLAIDDARHVFDLIRRLGADSGSGATRSPRTIRHGDLR
jgi:hypothetical protein